MKFNHLVFLFLCCFILGCQASEFISYRPSMIEREWQMHVNEWHSQLCDHLPQHVHQLELMERDVIDAMTSIKKLDEKMTFTPQPFSHPGDQLHFSEMSFRYVDGRDTYEITYLIEPLAGLLRDPFAIPCSKAMLAASPTVRDLVTENTQAKRNILLGPASPKHVKINGVDQGWTRETFSFESWGDPNARVFILDLGASTFGKWNNNLEAAAGAWLVQGLNEHGVDVTHYWAFEAQLNPPKEIWGSVPTDMRGHYTYINLPVSADPNNSEYPWRVLEQVAKPSDYVVVKVDIDSPNIENPLIDILLASPKYLSLIDELMYEHHVDIPSMHPWWGRGQGFVLADSYRLFQEFRKAGIRAHAWP